MFEIGSLTDTMFRTGTFPAPIQAGAAGGFLSAVRQGLVVEEAQGVQGAQPLSLEDRLKARYPGLAYHVFDGSSRYWQTRQDFPFHKIYQKECDGAEIENWRPSGPNPDGLDPGVQRNLGSIPPGSKAVIIHPEVQRRMEEDPAYADEIYVRIEAWFTFDVARNEAILPGCTVGMSQCLAIGEDGQIVNVQACGSGGLSRSKRDEDEDDSEDFWQARMRRHRIHMQQVIAEQILHKLGIIPTSMGGIWAGSDSTAAKTGNAMVNGQMAAMQASQMAIFETMAMMNGGELRAALGETVAGVSVDAVFEATRNAITGARPGIPA